MFVSLTWLEHIFCSETCHFLHNTHLPPTPLLPPHRTLISWLFLSVHLSVWDAHHVHAHTHTRAHKYSPPHRKHTRPNPSSSLCSYHSPMFPETLEIEMLFTASSHLPVSSYYQHCQAGINSHLFYFYLFIAIRTNHNYLSKLQTLSLTLFLPECVCWLLLYQEINAAKPCLFFIIESACMKSCSDLKLNTAILSARTYTQ